MDMFFRKISHFFQHLFRPLQDEDYSGLEYLILYLSLLFMAFLYTLQA